MERTKKAGEVSTGKPRWKKIGGGSLRMGNKIIKPGQIFEAGEDEISPAFKKFIIPVGTHTPLSLVEKARSPKGNAEVKAEVIDAVKPEFEIQPRGKSLFLFDVVNKETKKVMNDKSLKKEAAEKLVADLAK